MSNRIIHSSLRYLWLTFSIILIDWISKQWIRHCFFLKEKVGILPGVNIFYTLNYGSFFRTLLPQQELSRQILIIIDLLVIVILLLIIAMKANNPDRYWNNIALALVVGGGLSNLYDLIIYGGIIDFINLVIIKWNLITLNIADIAIWSGLFLIIASL
ncbi:MAG: signal peptidase II [Candidatus Dasytiphilus stammeri]